MVSVVQSKHTPVSDGTHVTTVAVTLNSNVTAGNPIVVEVGWGTDSPLPSSVTDNRGSTYSAISGALAQDAGNGQYMQLYRGVPASSGSCTITATFGTGRGYRSMTAVETAGTDVVDDASGQSATGTTPTTGAMTATVAGGLMLSFVQDTSVGSVGITEEGTPLQDTGATDGCGSQYEVLGGTGSAAGDFTFDGSRTYVATGVILTPVAGAGGPVESEPVAVIEDEVAAAIASVRVYSEAVQAIEDEAVNEPDVTIYVTGALADAVEDEVASAQAETGPIVVESEPVAAIEDETADAAASVRVHADGSATEDEVATITASVRVYSSVAAVEDEDVSTEEWARIFAALHAVEDEVASATFNPIVPSEPVDGVEDEVVAIVATVRVYSSLAAVEDEAGAVATLVRVHATVAAVEDEEATTVPVPVAPYLTGTLTVRPLLTGSLSVGPVLTGTLTLEPT